MDTELENTGTTQTNTDVGQEGSPDLSKSDAPIEPGEQAEGQAPATGEVSETGSEGEIVDIDLGLPTDYPEELTPLVTEYKDLAKEMGLNSDQAKQMMGLHEKFNAHNQAQLEEAQTQQLADWSDTAKNDDEIGGADDAFNRNLAAASQAMDRFATDEFKALLNPFDPADNPKGMGLGNHPEIIRLFHRLATQVNEDGVVIGGEHSQPQSREEILYTT